MTEELEHCHEAPFHTLGPLTTDNAPGQDHFTRHWCRDDRLVWLRDAMLRHTERAPGLPNKEDVKQGPITYKIAAHAADLATKAPGRADSR